MHKFRNFPTQFSDNNLAGNFKDKVVVLLIVIWIMPLILGLVYIFLNLGKMSNFIPIFYSRIWGESQLESKNSIFLPIGGVFFIGLINLLISLYLGNKDKLFLYLLLTVMAILSVLAFITVFNIINLIT